MAFKDLGDSLDHPTLLPIRGTTYRVPPVNAHLGEQLQVLVSVGVKEWRAQAKGESFTPPDEDVELLSDVEERNLYREVLTPDVYEAIKKNPKAKWEDIKRAAWTIILKTTSGDEAAERMWAGEAGKRPAPTDRKSPARKATTSARSRSTAAASTTRKRVSTSVTSSRKR